MELHGTNAILRKAVVLAAGLGLSTAVGAAEDPYVEFTGTQCVDTGYFVSGQTAVVADFQMTDATKQQALVWGAGNEMWSRLYISGTLGWSWSCMNLTGSQVAPYDNVATGRSVDCDRVVATVDGFHNVVKLEKNGGVWYEYTGSWDNLPHSETNTTTLKIGSRFKANDQGVWNYAKMKLYSFKVYEAGELVRDYIPATRDGVVGLYDRKNGGFVYDTRNPAGTGDHALVAGGELPDCPCTDAYVESNGTSAMNARMLAYADVRVEVDFAYQDKETPQQRVFGADNRPSFYINSFGKFAFATGSGGTITETTMAPDTLRHTVVVDYPNHKMQVFTGPTQNLSWDITDKDLEVSAPFAIFGNMNAKLNEYDDGFKFRHQAKVRIYSAKFYRAGELVYDYRPCVKGGVVGLKDAKSGEFICGENADAFTAGGDVERVADDPFVMLTGNNAKAGEKKWIDTGYFPGPTTKIVLDYALANNYPDNGEWFLMCAWTPASGNDAAERLNFEANTTSAVQWKNGTGSVFESVSSKLGAATTQRNVRRQLCYDAAKGTCTLVTAGFTNATATSAVTLTRKMGGSNAKALRLGGNTDATPINYAPLKIYGLKIYEGDELVSDFVPYVQNGIVGLRDTKTGAFKANATAITDSLDAGGTITGTAGFEDGYVEFTGAQTIDTGFYPTKKTRVVADFQMTSLASSPQQFVWSSNNEMCQRIYTQGSGKWGWFAGWNAVTDGCADTGIIPDNYRLTADIDGPTQTGVLTRDGADLSRLTVAKTSGGSCTTTMKIGSRFAANGTTWNFASMKLYSFKVYEDEKLERDYVPYVQDGVVGLWDKVYGTFAPNVRSGDPLKISATGKGSMLKSPEDATLSAGDEVTLSGLSSLAVSYQWYVNGEAVEGATGATFTVPWRKGKPNQDVISVVPTYDVFGVPTQGEESSATVTYQPNGTCILLR